jgi:hypothetical protein
MEPIFFNLIKVPCEAEKEFFDAVSSQRYVLDKRDSFRNELNQLVDCHIERVESDFFNYLESDRKQSRSIPTTRLDSYFYPDVRSDSDSEGSYTMRSYRSNSLSSDGLKHDTAIADQRVANAPTNQSDSVAPSTVESTLAAESKDIDLATDPKRVGQASISFERELVFKQIMISRPELIELQKLGRQDQEPQLFREDNFEQLLEYVRDRKRTGSNEWAGNAQLMFDGHRTQLTPNVKRKLQRLFELGLIDLETFTNYELLDRLENCRLLEVQF